MSNQPSEKPGFTLRAAVIAVAMSLFLLASSTYIAIKIGALPWPIVFSVIVSGGVLKLLSGSRKVSVHEVNVAQAGAASGDWWRRELPLRCRESFFSINPKG